MITNEEAKSQNESKLKELIDEINETQGKYEEVKSQASYFSREETTLLNRLNNLKKSAREISESLFKETR